MTISNEDYYQDVKPKIKARVTELALVTLFIVATVSYATSQWAFSCTSRDNKALFCWAIENPITTGDVFAVAGLLSAAFYFVVAPNSLKFPTSLKRSLSERIALLGGLFYICAITLNTVEIASKPFLSASATTKQSSWTTPIVDYGTKIFLSDGGFTLRDFEPLYFALAIFTVATFLTILLHYIYESEIFTSINVELRLIQYSKNLRKISKYERNELAVTLANQDDFQPRKFVGVVDFVGRTGTGFLMSLLALMILAFLNAPTYAMYTAVLGGLLYATISWLLLCAYIKDYRKYTILLVPATVILLYLSWRLYSKDTTEPKFFAVILTISLVANAIAYSVYSFTFFYYTLYTRLDSKMKSKLFILAPLGLCLAPIKKAEELYITYQETLKLKRKLDDYVQNALISHSRIEEVETENSSHVTKPRKGLRSLFKRTRKQTNSNDAIQQVQDALPVLEDQLTKLSQKQSETITELQDAQIKLARLSGLLQSQREK